jgi:hypothetical protein
MIDMPFAYAHYPTLRTKYWMPLSLPHTAGSSSARTFTSSLQLISSLAFLLDGWRLRDNLRSVSDECLLVPAGAVLFALTLGLPCSPLRWLIFATTGSILAMRTNPPPASEGFRFGWRSNQGPLA